MAPSFSIRTIEISNSWRLRIAKTRANNFRHETGTHPFDLVVGSLRRPLTSHA
jgi:hypothetical protein